MFEMQMNPCLTRFLLSPVSNRLAAHEHYGYFQTPLRRGRKASGSERCKPFDPERHFLPCDKSYHSGSVIVGSGSGRPLNHKLRALARATLGSFGTRIPLGFRTEQPLGPTRPRRSVTQMAYLGREASQIRIRPNRRSGNLVGVTGGKRRRPLCSILRPKSQLFGKIEQLKSRESRYRANSDTRTYRRVELEQRGHTNSGKTEVQSLKESAEGKSCAVSESRENSVPLKERKGVSL